MGLKVEVAPRPIDETYPEDLTGREIPEYLAQRKAEAFEGELSADQILITSDTVVWHRDRSLEKAGNRDEAIDMIQRLSGDWHEVISSVCLTTRDRQLLDSSITRVRFRELALMEIEYYVDHFRPLDKAGAYGIQEWIGLVGIEEIQGSYSNVVGLPTHLLYRMLGAMVAIR